MNEHEVDSPVDAAFFVANEVVNEYHSFPVVQRADIGGANCMYMRINEAWYKIEFSNVVSSRNVEKLERLAEAAADDDDDEEDNYNPEDYPQDTPRDQLDYPHNQPLEP
jgi:predicted lipid-binding transport protein (Tim44 family)